MASHPYNHVALHQSSQQRPWLLQQMLLVPEGVLLVVLLCVHVLMGGSAATGLIGIGLAALFGVRSLLLVAARRALAKANYRRAERLVSFALRMYPWSADALALRGIVYLGLGRPAQAESPLREAIALFPGRANLHIALSNTLLELEQAVEAREEGMHALALDPDCPDVYLVVAQAEQQLGAPLVDIERRLRAGIAVCCDPACEAALRCELALVLLALDKPGEARLAVVGVEALATHCTPLERAATLFHLGEVRRAQGDQETARTHFYASEQLDPHGRCAAAAWRAARM